MKKLISVFAAVALVGSLAAAPKRPAAKPAAPAIAAPAAPAVVAPTATGITAAANALGLRFGLHFGYVTDMFKKGDTLKKWAGLAGGGGLATGQSNASGSANCAAGATFTCSGSGDGSNVSLNGLDFGAKVEYDILPWLSVRSGFTYTMALKNTYTISQTTTNAAGTASLTNSLTYTATGNSFEIPMLLGFNLVQNEKSAFYFAGGVAFTSGTYETSLAAAQSGTNVTALGATDGRTWTTVENTTKQSGLGIMWLVGGRHKIAGGVSIFGEVKFLSAAAAKSGAVTGTNHNTTTATAAGTNGGYATSNTLFTTLTGASALTAGTDAPTTIQGNTATTYSAGAQTGTGGLDLSYTRWQVGVQYEL